MHPEALTLDANCHHGQHVRFSARHLVCQGCVRTTHKAQRRPGPPLWMAPAGHTLTSAVRQKVSAQTAASWRPGRGGFPPAPAGLRPAPPRGGVRVARATGLGSAAIAACTAAIFSLSEFTHCRPEAAATACRASTGSVKGCTRGMPAGAASGAAATGFATGAATTGAGCATGCAATGASTGAATGAGACSAAATATGCLGFCRRALQSSCGVGLRPAPPRLLAQRLRCLAVQRQRWCRRPRARARSPRSRRSRP